MTTSEDVAEMDRRSVLHTFTYLKDYASDLNDLTVMQIGKGVRIQEAAASFMLL